MKNFLRKILPRFLFLYLKDIVRVVPIFLSYCYDFKRYFKHSASRKADYKGKLAAEIIMGYHVVEKGLTMPKTRYGFGKERIRKLCGKCKEYILKFGDSDSQVKHAVSVLREYVDFHEEVGYQLDADLLEDIFEVRNLIEIVNSKQIKTTRSEYFSNVRKPFKEFSNSRSSLRNYSKVDIPKEKIVDILDLCRNTPSACNRQAYRVNVYTEKSLIQKILKKQGGNRGFGHLANKLLIVTCDLNMYFNVSERNQAFIDGGIYAMNLLYSLHYHEVAACILNCSHTPKKDKELRKLCMINESEVFIAMIACGIPPEEFSIASSKKYELDRTVCYPEEE
ncbi:nitroreductase family protein [Gracilimonas mengyeensis]|uniref:Nitroreductase n=1 Tax=Gracilimonas mengyeensis TaxID=1302730 RepID=A0A521FKS6_9BACT|nr:nitroreductase family protein [Gracilimonas mengyeensis]SMO96765.1 Nitroreductase [Gracilimonas mengyeensis]